MHHILLRNEGVGVCHLPFYLLTELVQLQGAHHACVPALPSVWCLPSDLSKMTKEEPMELAVM
eukprot:5105082-Ditylum_brightwellii.AAC.1